MYEASLLAQFPDFNSYNCVQPALSAYQRHLHHDIHGPNEPLPDTLAKRLTSGTVDPLKATSVHTPLPQLPEMLLEKQISLREVSPRQQQQSQQQFMAQPRPPLCKSGSDAQRITSLASRRKSHASSISKKRSSSLLLRSDPDTVLTCYSPPLESLTDPLEIVERLKREPGLGFLYLTAVDDLKSVRYNPYNLRQGMINHIAGNFDEVSYLASSQIG